MCGIYACFSVPGCRRPISEDQERQLNCRGPDYSGSLEAEIEYAPAGLPRARVTLQSSVLSLRGDSVTRQPLTDSDESTAEGRTGSALCWNGEAWRLGGAELSGNDGQAVLQALLRAEGADASAGAEGRRDAVLSVLRSIEGPFAFVFFDRPAGCVYFGRDRLGRRSLLQRRDTCDGSGMLTLCSIADPAAPEEWAEVEADGIYVVDLARESARAAEERLSADTVVRYAWTAEEADDASVVLGVGRFNRAIEPPEDHHALTVASPSVQQLREQLQKSLRLRVANVPRPPGAGRDRDTRVAVLFSGGLDCTVLARMAHDLLPAEQGIDLVNVAFENPRVVAHLRGAADAFETCPDRITGRKSFAELQQLCPQRAWRFIAVNVPYVELVAHRPAIVSLIHPHNTEMDLSIASALFFAARGTDGPDGTVARVLLSGLGADELFGGYGRHGIAFARRGYAGLVDELALDVGRLGKRNLGRDDRVTARWAKEVRYPFLDERLVAWALEQPVWDKCDFAHAGADAGAVEPAKRVLRLVAQSLGLAGAAQEKKRAIQFGARTAKMESGRTKGTSVIA